MTWTYDTGLALAKDKVRALIGDTDTNDQQLTDEQINLCLSQRAQNLTLASALACRMVASKYAREVSTSADGFSAQDNQKSEAYIKMAEQFEMEAEGSIASGMDSTISPLANGEIDLDDSPPTFTVGMHDNQRGSSE